MLDVGVDSLQHPLTGVLIGQVGVYLWERQADTWGRRKPTARGLATLRGANRPPTWPPLLRSPVSQAQAPRGPGQVTPSTPTPSLRGSQPQSSSPFGKPSAPPGPGL